jgi:hypothetical protein
MGFSRPVQLAEKSEMATGRKGTDLRTGSRKKADRNRSRA